MPSSAGHLQGTVGAKFGFVAVTRHGTNRDAEMSPCRCMQERTWDAAFSPLFSNRPALPRRIYEVIR